MSDEDLVFNAEEIFLELDRQETTDDFDIEVAKTRQNEKLMALLGVCKIVCVKGQK